MDNAEPMQVVRRAMQGVAADVVVKRATDVVLDAVFDGYVDGCVGTRVAYVYGCVWLCVWMRVDASRCVGG